MHQRALDTCGLRAGKSRFVSWGGWRLRPNLRSLLQPVSISQRRSAATHSGVGVWW